MPTCFDPQGITRPDATGSKKGAIGGIRTHNPVREAVFETAAYTIPPLWQAADAGIKPALLFSVT